VIHRLPKSLLDVHDLMVATGMDLLSALRERMLTWSREDAPLGARLILIAFFPKARTAGKPPEVSDIWTFLTNQNIRQLGATLGFWQALATGQVAAFVGADIDRQRASTVDVLVLNPSFALNRPLAALVNGYEPSTMQITAVGVGALGSQTIAKLVRGGFGFWTLVDNDHLLPHNVARHELPECFVGFPKAIAMQMLGNNLIEDQVVSDAIVADILYPEGDKREHLEAAFRRADLILDFSASIPVARHLAASDLGPRRISAFLNFDASDLVLLAEDTERHFPLDCLEMQYYREIITRPELSDHLSKTNDKWVRYGQTCRDLTLIVSEDRVGLHSAIASNAIRRVVQNTNATICVWRTASDLSVRAFTSPPAIIREVAQGDWRIRTDDVLLRRVSELRTERLPNETGGILIGAFDLERKIAYVVDTIPSPPDSKEWPVLYIRGCQGLPERLQQIDKMTVGMLQYVGEWHSHPDCCSTSPSAEDRKVFEWLSEHMRIDGLPPMMAIVGEGGNVNWLLGSLS
jgi:proteasome lid subunit RPN8/RPN11